MPTVDAVILDLGNVLVFHDNARLVRNLAERAQTVPEPLGEALSGELSLLINRGELGPEALRREVCHLLGADIPMPEFFELWSSHFTIHDAVLPRVEALSREVKLVLLSNTNALHFEWLRPKLPVLGAFHALVLSHEVHQVKPHPAIYRTALERAGVDAARAAFFDDIPDYADAASALGIHGRVFTTAAAFDGQLRELGFDFST